MLPAKHIPYPSAATCAFLAAAIEILSFGLAMSQRSRIRNAAETDFFLPPAWVYVSVALALTGIAAQARALWHVGVIQQTAAPLSARAGRCAVAAYIATGVLVFVVTGLALSGTRLILPIGSSIAHWPRIALTAAFACLGWASRGNTSRWQRWASAGLLATGALGILSVAWWLFGFPAPPRWIAGVHVALRAATWAVVGAWLRTVRRH